ncbi:hypothetical protein IPV08_23025 [Methylobacterium sp. SD274]|uniref:hypothetical protein n=1 Tax=Methylobacterium sp. SD274 TaxID=2782009 RepID=UPI001A956C86|nr:hypothetical protein [Methylobacterium sp. SD274]MBO1022836.1 hypothetical protein [Methylobacterium sp. SD274]
MKNVVYTVVFLLYVTQANADWQYTRWGMTVDEVNEASGKSLTTYRDDSEAKSNNQSLLIGGYKSDDIHFNTYFRFGKTSKLLETIILKAAPKLCGRVESRLIQTYGKPFKTDNIDKVLVSHQWFDRANNNKVDFIAHTGRCDVSYEPLPMPGAKGGL